MFSIAQYKLLCQLPHLMVTVTTLFTDESPHFLCDLRVNSADILTNSSSYFLSVPRWSFLGGLGGARLRQWLMGGAAHIADSSTSLRGEHKSTV